VILTTLSESGKGTVLSDDSDGAAITSWDGAAEVIGGVVSGTELEEVAACVPHPASRESTRRLDKSIAFMGSFLSWDF